MTSPWQHEVWKRKDYSGPWTLGCHRSSERKCVSEAASVHLTACKTNPSSCLLPEQGTQSGLGTGMRGLAELQCSLAAAFSSFVQVSEFRPHPTSLAASGCKPCHFLPCLRTLSHIKLKHTENLYGLARGEAIHP